MVHKKRYMISTGSSCHNAIAVVFRTVVAVLSDLSTSDLYLTTDQNSIRIHDTATLQ